MTPKKKNAQRRSTATAYRRAASTLSAEARRLANVDPGGACKVLGDAEGLVKRADALDRAAARGDKAVSK